MDKKQKRQRRISTDRLTALASAIDEVENMPSSSVSNAIRKVLRLLELCPWIETDGKEPTP